MDGWGIGGGGAGVGGGGTTFPPDMIEDEAEERTDALKLILYELNSAVAPRSARTSAIRSVLRELDHDDEVRHDEELDLQADRILFQRLALAYSVEGGPSGEEAGLVCSALEMVYRASRARVALSFGEAGEAMLPLLVEMIGDPDPDPLLPSSVEEEREKDERKRPAGVGAEGRRRREDGIPREAEEVERAPDADEDDEDDEGAGGDDDGCARPLANGFGPLDGILDRADGGGGGGGDNSGDDGDGSEGSGGSNLLDEEKKADSMANLEQAGLDDARGRRERDGAARGGAEGGGAHPERDGDAAEAAAAGNDHAQREDAAFLRGRRGGRVPDGEESRPQVRFSDGADATPRRRGEGGEDIPRPEGPRPGGTSALAASKVLRVLRYFSRVLSAMIPMAHHPGLLDALVYQLGRRVREEEEDGRAGRDADELGRFPDEGGGEEASAAAAFDDLAAMRVDAMATLVNLACAEENKAAMARHRGLLDAVLLAAREDPSEEAREHASIALMNLAYAEENRPLMAGRDDLLDALVALIGDRSPFTRRYASAALFTLACGDSDGASRMVRHRGGGILSALVRVLLDDPIDEARVNAAEALFNMARTDDDEDDAAVRMGDHPGLLGGLARAVVSDYSADVRAYAARTLEWLAADIHHPMPCHRSLLESLTSASRWTKTTCIAEALRSQSSVPDNRAAMVTHDGLLDALADLALLEGMNDEETARCAASAIERLSREESTRRIMVRNEGVMTALTKATFSKSGMEDDDAEDGSAAGSGEELDGLSVDSRVGTSVLTKNALKNLADAL